MVKSLFGVGGVWQWSARRRRIRRAQPEARGAGKGRGGRRCSTGGYPRGGVCEPGAAQKSAEVIARRWTSYGFQDLGLGLRIERAFRRAGDETFDNARRDLSYRWNAEGDFDDLTALKAIAV